MGKTSRTGPGLVKARELTELVWAPNPHAEPTEDGMIPAAVVERTRTNMAPRSVRNRVQGEAMRQRLAEQVSQPELEPTPTPKLSHEERVEKVAEHFEGKSTAQIELEIEANQRVLDSRLDTQLAEENPDIGEDDDSTWEDDDLLTDLGLEDDFTTTEEEQ